MDKQVFYYLKVIKSTDASGKALIPLKTSKLLIGRALNCDYIVTDTALSRSHALLQKFEDGWKVKNTSSNNIVVVDNVPLTSKMALLHNNSIIKLGTNDSYIFKFGIKEVPSISPPAKKIKFDEESSKQIQAEKDAREKEWHEFQEKLEMERIEMQLCINDLQSECNALGQKVADKDEALKEKETSLKNLQTKQQNEYTKLLSEKDELKSRIETIKLSLENKNATVMQSLENQVKEKEETLEQLNNLKEEKENLEILLKDANAKEAQLTVLQQNLDIIKAQKMALEQEVANTEVIKKVTKGEIIDTVKGIMDTELQCPICNELFITATVLNCGHTFCKYCIDSWKKEKNECPVCRCNITSMAKSFLIDNFIEKTVDSISEDLKAVRNSIMQARKEEEQKVLLQLTTNQANNQRNRRSSRNQVSRGRGRRRGRGRASTNNVNSSLEQSFNRVSNTPTINSVTPMYVRVHGSTSATSLSNNDSAFNSAIMLSSSMSRTTPSISNSSSSTTSPFVITIPSSSIPVTNSISNLNQMPITLPSSNISTTATINSFTSAPEIITLPSTSAPAASITGNLDTTVDIISSNSESNGSDSELDMEGGESSEVSGIEESYYGGYGRCFNCGHRGHWAPGCPF